MPNGNESTPTANKWAVMGGIALNVEYTRKYGFEATAAARVTAKLVAVPPPSAFQEAVQVSIVGRAKRAAALTVPAVKPPGVVPPVTTPPVTTIPPPLPPTAALDDDEVSTLSLIVVDKTGVEYTLDDGVNPPSEGQVAEDGTLIHRVSKRSERGVITFKDGSEPVELVFEAPSDQERGYSFDEYPEDWTQYAEEAKEAAKELEELEEDTDEVADYEETEALIDSWTDDDARSVSLMIPEHAGKTYTIDDGVNPSSQGVIDEDALLTHLVSPEAAGCTIEIEGEPEKIELTFSEGP